MKDCRRPVYLITAKEKELRKIDSDLLIALDENDVMTFRMCLKQHNVDVNDLYIIPAEEIPDAIMAAQTFLHRALFSNSMDVFQLLLNSRANPRLKDQCGRSVIDKVFQSQRPDKLEIGKKLVDAGIGVREIKASAEYDKSMAKELLHYLKNQKKPRVIARDKFRLRHKKNTGRFRV